MLHVTCDLFMKKYTYADINLKVNMHILVAYQHMLHVDMHKLHVNIKIHISGMLT